MKALSVGVLFVYDKKILMCKSYSWNEGLWDLCKGKREDMETPIDCILRECWEETNILLDTKKLIDLGRHRYLKNKDLYLFRYDADEFNIEDCKCNSTFEYRGQEVPEIVGYKLSDDFSLLYKSLQKVLEEIDFKI